MLPDSVLKPLYDKVMGFLVERPPFGEYFAMQEIFGQDVANRVAMGGEIMPPPGAIQTGPMRGLQSRSQDSDAMVVDISKDDDSMYLSD